MYRRVGVYAWSAETAVDVQEGRRLCSADTAVDAVVKANLEL